MTKGPHPVIIISNDKANEHAPFVTAVPLTSKEKSKYMPTHVKAKFNFLREKSTVLCEQIISLDKKRLMRYIGTAEDTTFLYELADALQVQLSM